VKAKVIPVTIGATGTISKTSRKYMNNIPGKHEIKELQRIAILGAAHIFREVPVEKYKTYFTCEKPYL